MKWPLERHQLKQNCPATATVLYKVSYMIVISCHVTVHSVFFLAIIIDRTFCILEINGHTCRPKVWLCRSLVLFCYFITLCTSTAVMSFAIPISVPLFLTIMIQPMINILTALFLAWFNVNHFYKEIITILLKSHM